MKVWMYGVTGIAAVALLGGALAMGVAAQSGDALPQGVRVGGVDVGGLNAAQAQDAVTKGVNAPQVTVTAGPKTWTLPASQLGWRADAAGSVAAAVQATEGRTLIQRLEAIVGQGGQQEFPLLTRVDRAAAQTALAALTKDLNTQPVNASVAFDAASKKYVVKPGAAGRQYDAAGAAATYAARPEASTLTLPVREWKAQYTADVLQGYADRGNALMRTVTFTLGGSDRKGALTPLQVANLYWVRPTGIVADQAAMQAAFGTVTSFIDDPAQSARYALRGGAFVKVKEQAGRVTDRQPAYALFQKAVLDPAQKAVTLPGVASTPAMTLAQLPDPGQLELIAVGNSTYYHSSPERRTNVANAAAKINGAVVADGDVFSFLNNLGGITPGNGFVGGLIISGGRTVDGLGGGVCQVSTTTFRALYQAGLPVVERNQHSYRVGYYEPQVGFEAAVYDPGVDLKFKNDTGAPILIKTVNMPAKSALRVEVWGIKPERTVSISPAHIVSHTPHPAAQYIVNPALRPGTSKQVDWAADGYNLYITRTIQDASGMRTDVTRTNYKPWRAVYEIGPRS